MVSAQDSLVESGFGNEKAATPMQPPPPPPVYEDAEAARLNRRRKHRRFGHFFFVLAGLFFVVHRLSRSTSEQENPAFSHGCTRSIEFPSLVTGASSWSDAGVNAQCVNSLESWKTEGPFSGHGSRDLYSAEANFDFTSGTHSSLSHFVESVGDFQHLTGAAVNTGNIAFVSSEEAGNVSVAVHVTYSDPSVLNMLRICNVEAGDEAGIVLGAMRPHRRIAPDPMFSIGVKVTIPQEGLSSEVKTKLKGFAHNVYPGVNLESLEIITDRAVHFQPGNIVGDVSVQTANSPITGFFNVSSNLKLMTSNAPIDVGVEAYHTKRHWPSTLRLVTSNANLNATLALKNTTRIGLFRVSAQTYNSPVNVTLLESPIDGYVRVEAKTKNAPALLELDPAFEGSFVAYTTNAEPSLEFKEGVEDPVGERERFVEVSHVSPQVKGGSVAWGKPLGGGHHKSTAGVATTNDPAVLVL